MNFELSEEQQLIADGANRFVRERYDFETRQALVKSDIGYSAENWGHFAEMGWLAMTLPEAYGGLDAGPAEVMLLMEAFGRGLVVEPYLPTVLLGAELIKRLGSDTHKQEHLTAIAEGREKVAFAFVEADMGYDLRHVAMPAQASDDGYILAGRKQVVLGGQNADYLVVLARTSASPGQTDGLSLFLLATDMPGLSRQAYGTTDGGQAADYVFDNVTVPKQALLGAVGAVYSPSMAVLDLAIAATLAEALGAMDMLNTLTGQYLLTRTQFGQPIGGFQVLQHKMADMVIAAEEARSMVIHACLSQHTPERAAIVSAAKVKVSEAARFVARQAVQMHGGMGVSDELSVGHYFKRIFMIESLFGDSRYHKARFHASHAR